MRRSIDSGQINDYIKEITGDDFTAKDFRTWGGTLEALTQFSVCFENSNEQSKSKIEIQVLDCVARKLGNTRAICKSSYVYPVLLEAHRTDALYNWLMKTNKLNILTKDSLEAKEKALLSFLQYHQRQD